MKETQCEYEGRKGPGKDTVRDGRCLYSVSLGLQYVCKNVSLRTGAASMACNIQHPLPPPLPLWATSPTAHSSPMQRIT